MSSQNRMGRNPFNKPSIGKSETAPTAEILSPTFQNTLPSPWVTRAVSWIVVDFPAESFVFGLKTVLFAKSIFETTKKYNR